jgi:uncharacterized protein (TIGR02001 family)
MRKFTLLAASIALFSGAASAWAEEAGGLKDAEPAPLPLVPVWDVAFGGSLASDYIFRGISQSARQPSAAFYTELRRNLKRDLQLYGAIAGESIEFPNRSSAEIDLYAGVRPAFDKLSFDLGGWYYWYPGGQTFDGLNGPQSCTNAAAIAFSPGTGCNILEANLNYWELFAKGAYAASDSLTLGASVFYAPSWLSTGADGTFGSLTAKLALPSRLLPKDVGAAMSAEFGHYWYGTTDAFYGIANTIYADGIPLPQYNTWNVGLALSYKVFTLDFRYYDTDLSNGDCDLLTGDNNARSALEYVTPTNPTGLSSNWCGETFVAKLSVDMTAGGNLK